MYDIFIMINLLYHITQRTIKKKKRRKKEEKKRPLYTVNVPSQLGAVQVTIYNTYSPQKILILGFPIIIYYS